MAGHPDFGARKFGRVNWRGLVTLARREVMRFLAIWPQTVIAPIFTAVLFMAVFALAFGAARPAVLGVSFVHFLAPGLIMMTVVQNAFVCTSSSLVVSKVQGNIVDTLMPPLSPAELVIGHVIGGVARGAAIAVVGGVTILPATGLGVAHPLWLLVFVVLGSAVMAAAGICAGILAAKFDQLNALTNFIVTPLAFLSGTFYSVEVLPPAIQAIAVANPIFHLIDGARFGVIGAADGDPMTGLVVGLAALALLSGVAWRWFATGYRLRD